MLNKSEIISALTPFVFIQEIADIQNGFENLAQENQEIALRKKLSSLKEKPFYHALNLKKLEPIIDRALLFLAENYPINHEDPITLETFEDKDYVSFMSGHRFKSLPIFEYFQKKHFKKISNPLTNEKISSKEMYRIVQTINRQHPHLLSNPQNKINKEIYNWKQSIREAIYYFENCSETQIHHSINHGFNLSILLFPIFNLLLAELIMLNYYTWFLSLTIPKIHAIDERFLMLANLISLILSQSLFKWFAYQEQLLPLPFPYFFKHNLINCGTIITLDLMSLVCKKLIEHSSFILHFRAYLLSYGSFFIAMHITYPKHHLDIHKYIHIAYAQMSFLLISNIIIKSYIQIIYPNNYTHELSNVMQANLLYYLPHTLFFYFIISELVKIAHEFYPHQFDEDALSDILRNPML